MDSHVRTCVRVWGEEDVDMWVLVFTYRRQSLTLSVLPQLSV